MPRPSDSLPDQSERAETQFARGYAQALRDLHEHGSDHLPSLTEAARLRDVIRRAAPFVNAVVVMAEDKTPGLAWLADASLTLDEEER